MHGLLLVDKPAGWTSFDVVAKVRGLARTAYQQAAQAGQLPSGQTVPKRVKVGHTGTLDPLATGLLVLLVGKATKQAPQLSKLDKTYQVTMKLGETSSTGDEEGLKTMVNGQQPSPAERAEAMQRFVGDSLQTPPAYSAIKINGQRAYQLARAGKPVDLKPRPVHIETLEITGYHYPLVQFTADVSSGTYIRSLVEDIGRLLGTGAYMTALRRTRVGTYRLADATTIEKLSSQALAKVVVD